MPRAAAKLRIAEQYVVQFGKLADQNNTIILPSNLADVGGIVAGLATVLDGLNSGGDGGGDAPRAEPPRAPQVPNPTYQARDARTDARSLAERLGDIAGAPPRN